MFVTVYIYHVMSSAAFIFSYSCSPLQLNVRPRVCLCNGFTSFHTGFTSLSIDFVFFFSSEIKVKLSFVNLHLLHCGFTQNISLFSPLDLDTHGSCNSIIHLESLDPLRNLSFFLNWHRCACFVCRGMFVFWQLVVSTSTGNKEKRDREAATPVDNDDDASDTKKTAESN